MKLLKYSLAIIFLAISVYLLVFRAFRVAMVIGESMTPTLHPYQLVIAFKTSNFKKSQNNQSMGKRGKGIHTTSQR